MTRAAMPRPAKTGARIRRAGEITPPEPRNRMRHQSMAKRKQTTASAAKMPMKTDSTRKKRSSRKMERRTGRGDCPAGGSDCSSASVRFMQLTNEKQGVVCGGVWAGGAGLPLDAEHQVHGALRQIGIAAQMARGDSWFHSGPVFGKIF